MSSVTTQKSLLFLSVAFALAVTPLQNYEESQEAIYRSLLEGVPETVSAFSTTKPSLANEIASSYRYLRDKCPAMSQVDISSPWNLAEWMNMNISAEEWERAPYSFRMNSFKAVSVQKNTETKIEVLGELYDAIPTHPAFLIWVDEGKAKFNTALHSDEYLNAEKADWENVVQDEARLTKYLSHAGRLFMASFIGDKNLPDVKIAIEREDKGWMGLYEPNQLLVLYNFSDGKNAIQTALKADEITAHEFFHVLQDVVKNWTLRGQVANNSAFADAGEKFFYGNHKNLAHISNTVDYDIYKNTFRERLAWYVMDAARPDSVSLQTAAPGWKEDHPLNENGSFPDQGVLPSACNPG